MRGGSKNVGMLQGGHGASPAGMGRGAPANVSGKAAGPQSHPARLEPEHLPGLPASTSAAAPSFSAAEVDGSWQQMGLRLPP